MHAEILGGAEARLYAILAEVISFPSDELVDVASSGLLATTVDALMAELPWAPHVPLTHTPKEMPAAGTMESEYICLFDVPDRVPTPLYTGVYAHRRRDAMEELLRIYRHFGLTVNDDAHDLPDYVPTVLEFLSYLADGAAGAAGGDRTAWERALSDVLGRHVAPWAAQTSERLAKREAEPFYRQVVDTIGLVARARLAELDRENAPGAASAGRA